MCCLIRYTQLPALLDSVPFGDGAVAPIDGLGPARRVCWGSFSRATRLVLVFVVRLCFIEIAVRCVSDVILTRSR